MPCPEIDELERHASGVADDETSRRVAVHVLECPTCRAQLDEISENLGGLGAVRDFLRGESATTEPPTPERIGPFRIAREVGRGGMGVVYLAEQERPRREVALKVLRPGAVSPATLRRFEHEAETLGRLRHPGIAAIYDAGVARLESRGTAEQVPYFAMEYVRGERLDRYVRSRGLDARARLGLLAQVADAVHHAHLNGIVHRDLKPGNIMVEPRQAGDGARRSQETGEPKVLDFGVARVADADRSAETLRTSTGEILGTVPYMSPEQLGGDPEAVDARSDVYALGVIGYEMLADRLPHDLRGKPLPEAARLVRDTEAPRLGRLSPALRGDIDAIFAKALEKDPHRRYQSASELAADIRRFLADEPIVARPPSAMRQVGRFARRNRALVAAGAALLVVLAVASVISTWLALRASRAERLSRERLDLAERESAKQSAVSDFLKSMLSAADPYQKGGRAETTVAEVLDRAAAELDQGRLAGEPEVETVVRSTLADTYWGLADYEAAEAQYRASLALCETAGLAEGRIYQLDHLGLLFAERSRYATAESLFRLQLAATGEWADADDEKRARWTAKAYSNLAGVSADQSRYARAESLIAIAVGLSRGLPEHDRDIHAANLRTQGGLRFYLGDNDGAQAALEEAIAVGREVNGPDHPSVVRDMDGLSVVLLEKGDLDGAERTRRELLDMSRRSFGDDHPRVASSMANLGVVHLRKSEYAAAESLLRAAVTMNRRQLGSEHRETARILRDLGETLHRDGRLDEAEAIYSESLAITRRVLGDDHPEVAMVLHPLGRARKDRKDYAGAEPLLTEALAIRRARLGPSHPLTLRIVRELVELYEAWNKPQRAAHYRAMLA
jgi:serine/threonine protein kinase